MNLHVWEVHVSHSAAVDVGQGKQRAYRANVTRWVVTSSAERAITLALAGLDQAEVIQVIRRSAADRTIIDPDNIACRTIIDPEIIP